MKIVQLGRGKGKTTEMLLWLLEGHAKGIDRALIVTHQRNMRELNRQLQKLYNENGQPKYINDAANRIYTVDAVRKLGDRHFRNCEIGIDNADEILMFLLNIHRTPSIISVTEDDLGMQQS